MTRLIARGGAICYALWGLLHFAGGIALLQSALAGSDAFLAAQSGKASLILSTAMDASSWTFAFFAFLLAGMGIISFIVAITANWRNSAPGYWFNLSLVFWADLGLFLFMIRPGIIPWTNAWPGPFLFGPAFFLSTWALVKKQSA